MEPVTAADVDAARARICGHVRRTPVLAIDAADLGLADGPSVQAKLDVLQPTGSFKVRGAASLLTSWDVSDAGVVAASGGNFGLAIAWAARRLGHRATIVVPATSPAEKIDPIRALGAEVVVVDGYYAAAAQEARRRVAEGGALLAHAYDQPPVVAGQGTATLELLEDVTVDTVLVACGGGGLLAGAVAAADGRVRIVAVETTGTPTLHAALDAGEPVDVEVSGVAASGLGAARIGEHAWAIRDRLATTVLVEDADVTGAQARLWRAVRVVAEPAGATALAALTSGRYVPAADERVGILVCGANTDPGSVLRPSAS